MVRSFESRPFTCSHGHCCNKIAMYPGTLVVHVVILQLFIMETGSGV